MQIVIDIQDDVYRVLKENIYPIPDTERLALVFKTLVEKGTLLPKGHGRLIDADKLIKTIEKTSKRLKNLDTINGLCGAVALIYDTPTVIEADRDCQNCENAKDGKCAGTEECHNCMWESQYKEVSDDSKR